MCHVPPIWLLDLCSHSASFDCHSATELVQLEMAPQSPTARRRSGRPFPSPTVSKSPDSEPKDPLTRTKRLKQEEIDPSVDAHAPSVASSTSSTSNGRAK